MECSKCSKMRIDYKEFQKIDSEFHMVRGKYIIKLTEMIMYVICCVFGKDRNVVDEYVIEYLNETDLSVLEYEFNGPMTDIVFEYVKEYILEDDDELGDEELRDKIYKSVDGIYKL